MVKGFMEQTGLQKKEADDLCHATSSWYFIRHVAFNNIKVILLSFAQEIVKLPNITSGMQDTTDLVSLSTLKCSRQLDKESFTIWSCWKVIEGKSCKPLSRVCHVDH